MEAIHILIVEEQPLFRMGIRAGLERDGHIIVGESTHISELEYLCTASSPSIAIIGDLTSDNPLNIARLVHRFTPTIAIIFLTENESEEHVFQAIKVGAAAYIRRTITEKDLLEAVRKVNDGEYLINEDVLSKPKVASRVLQSFRKLKEEKGGTRSVSPLSGRELEILDYISCGSSNKEIAKTLKISDQTVKNHITSILKKLSVNDRTAAVVQALKHGWINWEK